MGDGLGWVIAVNLVLWTGLFLYMLRLQGRVRAAERRADELEETAGRVSAGPGRNATAGGATPGRGAAPGAERGEPTPEVRRKTSGSER